MGRQQQVITALEQQRVTAQYGFEQRRLARCIPYAAAPTAVQAKRCRRIQRPSRERFVFVAHPAVPPDKNTAERSVRPFITSRKVSDGTRFDQGSATEMTLTTC